MMTPSARNDNRLIVDLVVHNANIVTVDEAQPSASAFAVLNGRFVAVGRDDVAVLPARQRVDADGATIVPGFNDAHNHMAWFGLSLAEIDLGECASLEDVYDAVAARATELPVGELIVGNGYDDARLGGKPDRARLDAAAGGRGVWLKHRSGHVCYVNTPLLERVGVLDGSAVVPEGGYVVTNGGEPTGELQEQAQNLVVSLVTPYSVAQLQQAVAKASDVYASEGLTHVTECGMGAGWLGRSPIELGAYTRAHESGRLATRVRLMPAVSAFHEITAHDDDGVDFALDLGVSTGFGDDHIRLGAMKIWLDGSLLARTAAMREEYACRCNPDHPKGYLQDDPARMRRQILAATAAGWDVAAHAIGDAAVDFALDVFAEAEAHAPAGRRPRHRIEHAGMSSDEQIARMAQLGVTPVPQPRFLYDLGDAVAESIGPKREHLVYRQRGFIDAGCRTPGSSDRPVADGAPLLAMATMQDRLTANGRVLGANEAVDAMTALRAYTIDGAWVAREDDRRGSITPGKLADFVVLDTDVSAADAEAVAHTTVLATAVDGVATYDTGVGLPSA